VNAPPTAPNPLPLADLPRLVRHLLTSLALVAPLGLAIGSACAVFLWSLQQVTLLRWEEPWLLYLLPLAGLVVGLVYHRWGRSAEGGTDLIFDAIHAPVAAVVDVSPSAAVAAVSPSAAVAAVSPSAAVAAVSPSAAVAAVSPSAAVAAVAAVSPSAAVAAVPIRMAPLVLFGTLVSHLFGGSAGREGTALQMGGGIAAAFAQALRFIGARERRMLLLAGMAGGFGGVFGTPIAGAVFALEVIALGRVDSVSIVPCLVAAIAADWACGAWGVAHTAYQVAPVGGLALGLLVKVVVAGAAFGLAARFFSTLLLRVHHRLKALIARPYLRPVIGGIGVIGLALVFGADYLGLGVTNPDPHAVSVVSAFHVGGAEPWSWLLKIVFTVMTLASGFKGGEVTPLFFVGATLGNTLAGVLSAPTDLFAGLGFVAVFGAAANTPLACMIMAVELFGGGGGPNLIYFAVACFMAYLFAGQASIYRRRRRDALAEDVQEP